MSLSDNLGAAKNTAIGADFEVQKLKDLVKKLERQNKHLRDKTGKLSPYSRNDVESSPEVSYESSNNTNSYTTQYNAVPEDSVLEYELKKLDKADDTTWLYVSPTTKRTEEKHVLEKWVREDLDHPSTPQLAMMKKNFIRKLESPFGYDYFKSDSPMQEIPSPYLRNSTKSPHQELPKQNNGDSLPFTPKSKYVPIERQLFTQEDEEDKYSQPTWNQNDVFHSPKHKTLHTEEKVHHMPLPSHTMTSAHGLVPSSSVNRNRRRSPSPQSGRTSNSEFNLTPRASARNYSPVSRGESPTRRSRLRTPERAPLTPKIQSPPSQFRNTNSGIRRSMPDMQRGRSSSPRQIPESKSYDQSGVNNSGISRLRMSSGLPQSQSSLYGANPSSDSNRQKPNVGRQLKAPSRTIKLSRGSNSETNTDSLSASQSSNGLSRSLTPRRSLPRPSQASRNQTTNSKIVPESVRKSHTTPNISTDHLQPDTYSSPGGSESGSSDVWKDGEFY